MNTIKESTRHAARRILNASANRTATVYFIKRTTGALRRMVCIHYPGAAEKARFRFNPQTKGLLAVWDVEKGARRFINLDGVRRIVISGEEVFNAERTPEPDRPALPPARKRKEVDPSKHDPMNWENFEDAERAAKYFFG